jgi:hypothetical protein
MPKGFLRTALALLTAAAGGTALADDAKMVTRSYPVGELVVGYQPNLTPPTPVALVHATQPAPVPAPMMAPTPVAPVVATFAAPVPAPMVAPTPMVPTVPTMVRSNAESLARLMTNMVKPYSWSHMGGAGTVRFDPATWSLVVTQTADVHAHVADLMASMRRIQAASMPQVLLTVTVLEVPEAFFETAGIDAAPIKAVCGTTAPCCPEGGACQAVQMVRATGEAKPVALTDCQVNSLMECVRAGKRATIVTRPQMVVTDMQTGSFRVGETARFLTGLELTAGPNGVVRRPQYQTVLLGTTINATPKVSADRSAVELRLNYRTAQPATKSFTTAMKIGEGAEAEVLSAPAVDIQMIESTLTIPAGKTVLMAGPMGTRETRILSKVPQTDHLLTTTGQEKYRHLLLVKATVMTPGCEAMQVSHAMARVVGTAKAVPPKCATTGCPAPCAAGDCKACPEECQTVAVAKPARPVEAGVTRLVAAYRQACTEGRTEDAMRLAMQALSRDPSCFADEK